MGHANSREHTRPQESPLRARTLVDLRSRLGERPREFSRAERAYVQPKRPPWLDLWDPLALQLRQAEALSQEGRVRWAAVVQANALLWRPGSDDLPGVLLVDLEGACEDRAWELSDLAHELYQLSQTPEAGAAEEGAPEKGLRGTPEEREAVREFLEAHQPAVPLRLGPGLSGGRSLELVTVLLSRGHLPDGVMVDPVLPVWVRRGTRAVLPIPAAYWPDRLLYSWGALGRRPEPARPWEAKQVVGALLIALLVCGLAFGAWSRYQDHLQAQRLEEAAQAAQRARLEAKRQALLTTQTLAANLARLRSAAPAARPATLARWREEQGTSPGSRLAVFGLASGWPASEAVDAELLASLEQGPLDPGELLSCLELPQLKATWRRALLGVLREREELAPALLNRLEGTPETPDLERLEVWLGFGGGGPEDLARLLELRTPRWLETDSGQAFLERVAERGPQTLAELAEGVDLRVRRQAARALGRSGHPEAEPLRVRLREDPDPEVRHEVRAR